MQAYYKDVNNFNEVRISLKNNTRGQRFLQATLMDRVTQATLARRLTEQQQRVAERQAA